MTRLNWKNWKALTRINNFVLTVARRQSVKKILLKILQNPQENTFFNKVTGLRPTILLKERPWNRCFLVSFAKFLSKPLLQNISGGCFWIADHLNSVSDICFIFLDAPSFYEFWFLNDDDNDDDDDDDDDDGELFLWCG